MAQKHHRPEIVLAVTTGAAGLVDGLLSVDHIRNPTFNAIFPVKELIRRFGLRPAVAGVIAELAFGLETGHA